MSLLYKACGRRRNEVNPFAIGGLQDLRGPVWLGIVDAELLCGYHRHGHGDHIEKHHAHHGTHEHVNQVRTQLEPILLDGAKIGEDLSPIPHGQDSKGDAKEVSETACAQTHAQDHAAHEETYVPHPTLHQNVDGVRGHR